MLLTCEKCHTKYNIADAKIGNRGREVRCAHCGYKWFQTLQGVEPLPEIIKPEVVEAAPPPSPPPPPPVIPPKPAVDDSFASELAKEMAKEDVVVEQPSVEKADVADIAISHKEELVQTQNPEVKSKRPPRKPLFTFDDRVVAFGFAVFFACILVTLSLRGIVARHYPSMMWLYGEHVKAIELSLEGMTAEYVSPDGKIALKGYVLNKSDRAAKYAGLDVVFIGKDEKELKALFVGSSGDAIEAGKSAPLAITLDEIPDNTAALNVRLREKSK